MNDEDRRAFGEWISGPPYERSVDRYPNDPTRYGFPGSYREHDVDLCKFAWLAALAHRDKQVAELVEAVDELMSQVKTHSASSSVGTGPMHTATITDLSLLVKLKNLAAKLKDQHNETK